MIPAHDVKTKASTAPRLHAQPLDARSERGHGVLQVAWQLTNLASAPIAILEGWLPHSRFFGERQRYEPVFGLAGGARAIIRRSVRFAAGAGDVVENAFLILRVLCDGRQWRVFIKMRVECTAPGCVHLVVEAVTTQPVGYAQASMEEEPWQ